MKSFVCAAGLAAGASAAILPRQQQCTFGLTASGGAQGQVGQLSDGQNRVGGGHPAGSYSLSNGGVTDSQGRGCILTPPTTQFQCDMGATPSTGFSIGGNGQLEHNGSPTFYACPAASGEYNIYTKSVDQQEKCVQITLSTGGKCTGSGSGSGSGNSGSASSGGSQPTAPAYSQPASSVASSAPASSSAATSQAPPAYSQPATSASSAPASSAPAYSSASQPATSPEAPSYSKPATSASSAPAYSSASQPATSPEAPSYSQPATSAPAGSSPAGYGSNTAQSSKPKVTSTVHSTVHSTVQTTMNAPAPSYSQPASSSKPAASGTAPAGSGSASGSACQTSLTGAYQTPHLIVPVNSAQPDKAYGTQYNATISPQECTIFNFDIPQSYQGKSCSTVFLFPEQSQLETSSFSYSGSGSLVFSELSSAADQQTCWNNAPSKKNEIGSVAAKPGNSYAVGTESCAAGTTQSIEVCSSNGLSLEFFEDWNPSPIGVYITSC